ncbi:MAG: NADH-quinone oxidoreductase subunit I [Bacteroidetes bacterium]|nr:NADH-quinone oxidoreductase subunit I [Bacteroidota bacterium]
MVKYFKNIWSGIYTVIIGMKITLRHLFVKKVTIQYPDERFTLPERERNRLKLEMSRCNGCRSCTIACPVDCILIETVKASPDDPQKEFYFDGKERKMWVTKYEIDFAKCCYCGLCTEACPTDAIKHTEEYEYSEYKIENLVYKFQTLSPEEIKEKERLIEEFRAKKEKDKPNQQTSGGTKDSGEKTE